MGYRLDLASEPFLERFWQREHLYIPGGFPAFEPPADADELAGLAMDAAADARIIAGQGQTWSIAQGPFDESDYQRSGPWSLLVHGVDRHWDEAADLLRAVAWLPGWRLDDVMMSYATDGGSAGPHFDNYDVFIIQAEGRRHWQIGQSCDATSPLMNQPGLRLLAEFEPRAEYTMEPGDVLYIPPGCAHHGVSLGESTSFSIGFRAPRLSDLLARLVDDQLERIDDAQLLRDPGRAPSRRAGEITATDIDNAKTQLLRLLDEAGHRWFGEAVTQPGNSMEDSNANPDPGSAVAFALAPGARLAWTLSGPVVQVYASGSSREFPAELAVLVENLCAGESVSRHGSDSMREDSEALLQWLCEEGTIEPYEL